MRTRLGRLRRSTVVLAVVFLGTLVTYFAVRPNYQIVTVNRSGTTSTYGQQAPSTPHPTSPRASSAPASSPSTSASSPPAVSSAPATPTATPTPTGTPPGSPLGPSTAAPSPSEQPSAASS